MATSAGLAVARGTGADPAELARRAIAALGGIERFVKPGANVVIKPNICVAYHGPEYAATTNPDVVAAIVGLCRGAGAARVRVMDAPFGGTAQNAYDRSGIAQAVGAAGGEMEVMSRMKLPLTRHPGRPDDQGMAGLRRRARRGRADQHPDRQGSRLDPPLARHEEPDGPDPGPQFLSLPRARPVHRGPEQRRCARN